MANWSTRRARERHRRRKTKTRGKPADGVPLGTGQKARARALNRARQMCGDRADPLGLNPRQTVAVLCDLGLSAEEIARYHGIHKWRVQRLLDPAPC